MHGPYGPWALWAHGKQGSNNDKINVKNIKNVLREVEEILESNIKQKIKMARYVDKLLKQKSRQYAKEQVQKQQGSSYEDILLSMEIIKNS